MAFNSKFQCFKCQKTVANNLDWKGKYLGRVDAKCKRCGNPVTSPFEEYDGPVGVREMHCEVCNSKERYRVLMYRFQGAPTLDIKYSEAYLFRLNGQANVDPFFGMDLVLQTEFKAGVIWFYNLDHLLMVKEYLAAKHRTDKIRHKYSISSNLPTWMKSAKNRSAILKKIAKLEIVARELEGK